MIFKGLVGQVLQTKMRARSLWVDIAAITDGSLIVLGWFTTPYEQLHLEAPTLTCKEAVYQPTYLFSRSDVIDHLVRNSLYGVCRIDIATSFVFVLADTALEEANLSIDGDLISLIECPRQFSDIDAVKRYETKVRSGLLSISGKTATRFLAKSMELLSAINEKDGR